MRQHHNEKVLRNDAAKEKMLEDAVKSTSEPTQKDSKEDAEKKRITRSSEVSTSKPRTPSKEKKMEETKSESSSVDNKPFEEPSSGSVSFTALTTSTPHGHSGPGQSDVTRRSEFIIGSSRDPLTNKDVDFNDNIRRAREAMNAGVHPQLIPAGSSGSYFVRDKNGDFLAVFKPKDEEPFAPLNPKWPKFFQRILCFCCFGRACLIPNNGYLSETGASLIDDRLCLNIVPKTRVVRLSSSAFFYGRCCGRVVEPYPKEGSYQLFVHGFKDAGTVFSEWNQLGGPDHALSQDEQEQFLIQFQKMVVLDYIIRNTDRHNENWLIRQPMGNVREEGTCWHVTGKEMRLAAIDNGLAFPVKHPESASRFRQFPFGWATLSWAQKPWNEHLRIYLLQLLTPLFMHNLCQEIKHLFRYDNSTNPLLNRAQLCVLRGQVWNLRQALLNLEPPCEMVKRPQVIARRRYSSRRLPVSDEWEKCFKIKQSRNSPEGCCC
ncbi:hypothetical protein L596_012176 [Steinernema carpocapsae]|uniref:Phosphatidylinositol 4-kinase type 2 n=1 Tax=Steinernema carpocapsae TaxID=34508 RepID=A0A4U5NWX1_STECR|nr:hypothetical protein L596_012176 [Steinernema carpocapsae]